MTDIGLRAKGLAARNAWWVGLVLVLGAMGFTCFYPKPVPSRRGLGERLDKVEARLDAIEECIDRHIRAPEAGVFGKIGPLRTPEGGE